MYFKKTDMDISQYDNNRNGVLVDTLKLLIEFIDNVEVGLYITDFYTGEILLANDMFASMINCTPEELAGKTCWGLFNHEGEGRCTFYLCESTANNEDKPFQNYGFESCLSPSNLWLKGLNRTIPWINGHLAHMVTFYDITEIKKIQNQVSNLVYVDQKLQIKNTLKLEQEVREAQPKPSVISFDILSLRKINEIHGRHIGDHLLAAVCNWIAEQNIPNSELYRIDGDQFCLTVKDIEMDELKEIAEDLVHRFKHPWIFQDGENKLQIFSNLSIGIIHGKYIQENGSLLNLIARTVEASRKNEKIAVYDEKMDSEYKKRVQLELSLKSCALNSMEGFEVYYQPIVDPVTGTWCGLEALCRWNCLELGIVSPMEFIPEAERSGLIQTIGLWVLETSVQECKAWGLDKYKEFILDVNLSAVQFTDETLAAKILKTLKEYEYPREKLCLEITESTQFTFTDQSLRIINELSENYILVALDDFGTGYSSFNNLKTLPINILKLERAFITDIETDSYQQYLFRAITELAHVADMKLVAEGVERKKQMEILVRNGADYLQGYLFSQPLKSSQLQNKLHRFH